MIPIDVVMPVYNAKAYVADAIGTICAQTGVAFRFIIVDDGSTDGTTEICMSYARRDPRVLVISRPNTGMTRAINEGMSRGGAPYVARMDADDLSFAHRLRVQSEYLDSHRGIVAIGAQAIRIDPDGWEIDCPMQPLDHDEIEASLLDRKHSTHMSHPTLMIRRDALERVGGYSEEFSIAQDRDLLLKLSEVGRLANLPDVLLKYRVHAKSLSHAKMQQHREESERAVLNAYQRRGLDPSGRLPRPPVCQKAELDYHVAWSQNALAAGNYRTARKHSIAALRISPGRTKAWKVLLKSAFKRESRTPLGERQAKLD
jgi:glycosyltransferase involved in cell wall biosynthesis